MAVISELTDAQLQQYKQALDAEVARRQTLARAESQAAQLNADYLAASGIVEGDEWRQPTGAVDSYPLGWAVAHNGTTWVSLMAGNPYEPGVSSWREVTDEGALAEWVQPTGAHDAYKAGARVTHNGQAWTSTVDANTWEPGVYGWAVAS